MNNSSGSSFSYANLYDSEIHLWLISLQSELAFLGLRDFYDILSAEERKRASRYYFAQDMHNFVVRRGMLRKLTAYYLDIEPKEVVFQSELYGKPNVQNPTMMPLQFNVSHSHNAILLGFTAKQRIGVDIEYINKSYDIESLLNNNFSPGEKTEINNAMDEKKYELFFKYWTLKEAFVKATGSGLREFYKTDLARGQTNTGSILLDPSDVSCKKGNQWSLKHLNTYAGYSKAVAIEGSLGKIRCWTLDEYSSLDVTKNTVGHLASDNWVTN